MIYDDKLICCVFKKRHALNFYVLNTPLYFKEQLFKHSQNKGTLLVVAVPVREASAEKSTALPESLHVAAKKIFK